jgi:transglutaminase-like putative cysteine protease
MIRWKKQGVFRHQYGTFLLCLLFGVVAVASLVSQIPVKVHEENEDYRYFTLITTVTYENKNTNGTMWQLTEDEKELGLFMNNSWQTVYLLNASYPIEKFSGDEDGNLCAFMDFLQLTISPGENLTYTVFYKVVLKPRALPGILLNNSGTLADIPQSLVDSFCLANGPWQLNDPAIDALADEVAADKTKVLEILLGFVTWIEQNIRYETLDVPRYPNETLLQHAGDCDDQANLLISLCRATGIPAYLQVGCIYMPTKRETSSYWNGQWISTLTRIGWHGWAIVYVPPWGWLPVDLTIAEDAEIDPLNSIANSAIITQPTVQYGNVTVTDYVLNSLTWRNFVISDEFHIQTHDTMIEDASTEQNSPKYFGIRVKLSPFFYLPWLTFWVCWLSIFPSFGTNSWFFRIANVYK